MVGVIETGVGIDIDIDNGFGFGPCDTSEASSTLVCV